MFPDILSFRVKKIRLFNSDLYVHLSCLLSDFGIETKHIQRETNTRDKHNSNDKKVPPGWAN